MKKIICCLMLAVMLSACGSETKKADERKEGEKRVGDIIMVNGALGVVFAVTTDGQRGMAMSISETNCTWENAKTWCDRFGYGWRLPLKDELLTICNRRDIIDSALKASGHEQLRDDRYWCSSSYEYNDLYRGDCACRVTLATGYVDDDYTGSCDYVRAVTAF